MVLGVTRMEQSREVLAGKLARILFWRKSSVRRALKKSYKAAGYLAIGHDVGSHGVQHAGHLFPP